MSEFPNRRRLEPTGIENTYDVVRAEGNVTETGDPFAEDSMNDLEERIAAGLAEGSISTATHTRTGTVNNLSIPDGAKNLTFLAAADLADGDTWTINGQPVTAKLQNGEALPGELFKSGCWVTGVYWDGAKLNFKSAGGSIKWNILYGKSPASTPVVNGAILLPELTALPKNINFGITRPATGSDGDLYFTYWTTNRTLKAIPIKGVDGITYYLTAVGFWQNSRWDQVDAYIGVDGTWKQFSFKNGYFYSHHKYAYNGNEFFSFNVNPSVENMAAIARPINSIFVAKTPSWDRGRGVYVEQLDLDTGVLIKRFPATGEVVAKANEYNVLSGLAVSPDCTKVWLSVDSTADGLYGGITAMFDITTGVRKDYSIHCQQAICTRGGLYFFYNRYSNEQYYRSLVKVLPSNYPTGTNISADITSYGARTLIIDKNEKVIIVGTNYLCYANLSSWISGTAYLQAITITGKNYERGGFLRDGRLALCNSGATPSVDYYTVDANAKPTFQKSITLPFAPGQGFVDSNDNVIVNKSAYTTDGDLYMVTPAEEIIQFATIPVPAILYAIEPGLQATFPEYFGG